MSYEFSENRQTCKRRDTAYLTDGTILLINAILRDKRIRIGGMYYKWKPEKNKILKFISLLCEILDCSQVMAVLTEAKTFHFAGFL